MTGAPQQRRTSTRPWAFGLSLALHAALFALFLPWASEMTASLRGGTGFGEDEALRQAAESTQGGREGRPERVRWREAVEITVTRESMLRPAPPPPPTSMLRDADVPPLPERPRPPRFADTDPSASGAPAAGTPDALADQGQRSGQAGAPSGMAAQGAGAGGSDRPRRGDAVSGAEIASALTGRTLIGTEGFYDGSAPQNRDNRSSYPWIVYYAPDGMLEARFVKIGSAAIHGPLIDRHFRERGTWTIEGDMLCQAIDRWGDAIPVCFEVHMQGDAVAMYYADCGALIRCFTGRLGPEGVMVPGRRMEGRP